MWGGRATLVRATDREEKKEKRRRAWRARGGSGGSGVGGKQGIKKKRGELKPITVWIPVEKEDHDETEYYDRGGKGENPTADLLL